MHDFNERRLDPRKLSRAAQHIAAAPAASVAYPNHAAPMAVPMGMPGMPSPGGYMRYREMTIDEMLLETAGIFEDENRHAIERMLALLAPALTVFVGVVVALVVASILMAVLSVDELAL